MTDAVLLVIDLALCAAVLATMRVRRRLGASLGMGPALLLAGLALTAIQVWVLFG